LESPKSVLVIYRLKFKSKPSFENAIQAFRFGEKLGMYFESLERSLSLKPFEVNYPKIIPPEINLCKDDLVIYVCSYENAQYLKGPATIDVMSKRTSQSMPRPPYYYELFLKSTFGSIADLSIASGDPI
jgi:hypothetical protein